MPNLNNAISDRRRQTRSSIYHYLYQSPESRSKQDISRDLNLSLPTVYQNITELLDAGLIEYAGSTPSAGGRPAMQLRITPGARCAIGISVTGHRLRFAATDLSREEIAYKDLPHSYNVEDEGYSAFVADALEIFIDESRLDRNRILGVGISVAGIIPPDSATVLFAPTLYIRNLSLKGLIDAIPYPVLPWNDASSGGFAEWYGGKEARESIAFLSLAEGVGGAVLVNGDQYIGNNYRSGEFGHTCVEPNGLLCSCGKRGCLEAYCSSKRLSTDLGITLAEFFNGLEQGNAEYAALWKDFKNHLVVALHNIRMTLDCDIVLGGYLTGFLKPYLPELKEMLAEADPFEKDCSYLRISRYSKDSSMLGVALTFIRDYLNSI